MTRLTIELPDDVMAAFTERAKAAGYAGAEAYLLALARAEATRMALPAAHEPHTWTQIEAKLREALEDPSPPIPMTPEAREALWREAKERRAMLQGRAS